LREGTGTASLLHYRPTKMIPSDAKDKKYWLGWHKDFSVLSGLVPALYTDDNGNEISISDPHFGLYITEAQSGEKIKFSFPKDCLAF
jgi:hypothetical protein